MIPREILKKIRQIELRTTRVGVCACFLTIVSLVLCSCTTKPLRSDSVAALQLPAEVDINRDAGRGGHLVIKLRLQGGEEVPVVVDTGAPATAFDKSLEPKLGKFCGTMPVGLAGGKKQQCNIFKAPRIFLGNTALVTGPTVVAYDFKGHPMGILGMDCLKHYRIQLDFQAGKMRFLSSNDVNVVEPGTAFPLTFKNNYPFLNCTGLFGDKTNLLVDTGCNIDGVYDDRIHNARGVYLPECNWSGGIYTNLTVAFMENANLIGIGFLARHLVTFDFPGRTLYLKETSVGPLARDEESVAWRSYRQSALKVVWDLKRNDRLPGWSQPEKALVFFDEPTSDTPGKTVCGLWTINDPRRYHYQLIQESTNGGWKLEKAWGADQSGNSLEEYPIP